MELWLVIVLIIITVIASFIPAVNTLWLWGLSIWLPEWGGLEGDIWLYWGLAIMTQAIFGFTTSWVGIGFIGFLNVFILLGWVIITVLGDIGWLSVPLLLGIGVAIRRKKKDKCFEWLGREWCI